MTKRRKSFTLVELLVAVGLLSLIVMLLLQLFGGAQKIWIASEKTNNVYANSRVAMELMADILNTVQFSHGEKEESGNVVRDKTKDMIFSLDSSGKDGDYDSNSVIFVAKTARELPMKDNTTRFISFRLGDSGAEKTRGKIFMVVYSDKNSDFYNFFPPYKTSNRSGALSTLKANMNSLVSNYSSTSDGENENCQVIAENVVEFKINAYVLDGGKLKKKADAADVAEPPHMIELRMTVLDPDSYKRWQELSGDAKTNYFKQHTRTFTRSVHIGSRWDLETK